MKAMVATRFGGPEVLEMQNQSKAHQRLENGGVKSKIVIRVSQP